GCVSAWLSLWLGVPPTTLWPVLSARPRVTPRVDGISLDRCLWGVGRTIFFSLSPLLSSHLISSHLFSSNTKGLTDTSLESLKCSGLTSLVLSSCRSVRGSSFLTLSESTRLRKL